MNRTQLRFLIAGIATMLTFAIVSAGPAAARPPGWGFDPIVTVPGSVTPGRTAAYDVKIRNTGKSNISSVLMQTDLGATNPLAVPVYISDATWTGQPAPLITRPCGSAPYTAALSCSFGNLVAGATVSLRIAFDTPSTGSSWSFNFVLTGNGDTPSDTGGTSHGDTKKGLASTTLSSDPDYAGGFVVDAGEEFATVESLTKQNPQSAKVVGSQNLAIATIQESNSFGGAGTLCSTAHCIGQWATLTAPNPDDASITGSLLIYGKGMPGSVGPEDIVLNHFGGTDLERGDDGVIGDEAGERCSSATDSASAPCIFVEELGQNFRITFWLLHNGTLRGTW